MKAEKEIKGVDFVLIEDLNFKSKIKTKIKPLIEELVDIIGTYSGKTKIIPAETLNINFPEPNNAIYLGSGGLQTSYFLKLNQGILIPITREFNKDKCVGFKDYYNNVFLKDSPYTSLLNNLKGPIMLVDDWVASGETLKEIRKYIKNDDVSAMCLVSTIQSNYERKNIGLDGFKELYVGADIYKPNLEKVRGYTLRALIEKSENNPKYLDLFIKKRCGEENKAKNLIYKVMQLWREEK